MFNFYAKYIVIKGQLEKLEEDYALLWQTHQDILKHIKEEQEK